MRRALSESLDYELGVAELFVGRQLELARVDQVGRNGEDALLLALSQPEVRLAMSPVQESEA